MQPTTSLFAKALRLPLNSKKGNADFYKGTRTGNVLRRRRVALMSHHGTRVQRDDLGREKTWNIKGHRLDESRMISYVVPPGLSDTTLQPYVFRATSWDADAPGVQHPRPGYPSDPDDEERVALPAGGLDGRSYEELRRIIWSRRKI